MKAIAGKRYRHYKGGEYTVLAISRMEKNPEELYVAYRAEYTTEFGDATVWLRPLVEFEEQIKLDEKMVDRFLMI
jgi:hypothetical protein